MKFAFFSSQISLFSVGDLKGKLKPILSSFAGSFMLPIATLAITAVFLSIGAFIQNLVPQQNNVAFKIGLAIKSLAFPILSAIPLLFCISFCITFSKNNEQAIWCAVIGYLTFIFFQSAFIDVTGVSPIQKVTILFSGAGRSEANMRSLIHSVFGVHTLNTSIFGSLLIGGVMVPYLFRNYSEVQLPKYISFFSGKRFVPFLTVISSAFLALLFLIFWPWVGYGMQALGSYIAKTPYGIDSFIFGFFEKALLPVGLHHIFSSTFWYTPLGGDASYAINALSGSSPKVNDLALSHTNLSHVGPLGSWMGDSFMGISIVGLPGTNIESQPAFEYFAQKLNINVGRFTQGKFPVMQFGLPAAGLAMYYAAPKHKRDDAYKVLMPAALTSAILGITEPMEFTFLFLAPKLFYGFHAVMCGVSFLLMNVLGAHIPTAFSGGFIELVIFGVIPLFKGTMYWWWAVVGMILAPIYFIVFYAVIKKFDLKTPGRECDTAECAVANNKVVVSNSEVPEKTRLLALGFGGWDNLGQINNCASRLRYDIVDKSKVDEAKLKSAGALAIKWISDTHVQVIVGPQAESINNEMVKWRGKSLGDEVTEESEGNVENQAPIEEPVKPEVIVEPKLEESNPETIKTVPKSNSKSYTLDDIQKFISDLGGNKNILKCYCNKDQIFIQVKNKESLDQKDYILDFLSKRWLDKNTLQLTVSYDAKNWVACFEHCLKK